MRPTRHSSAKLQATGLCYFRTEQGCTGASFSQITGVTLGIPETERLAKITAAAGCWLVIDNTYEQFLYSGKEHRTVNAPNIFHVFSFSKA